MNGKPRFVTEMSMIAGGTGITPCYQVLAAILRDPEDKTTVRLLFANRTPDDILARDVLEELAAKHPDRFMLNFTVDKVPSEDDNVSPSDEKNSKSAWERSCGLCDSSHDQSLLVSCQ